MWDVAQYRKFSSERTRPAIDLIARLPDRSFSSAADLGCGTGEITTLLADRCSGGIAAVDSSPEMLRAAKPHPKIRFIEADVATWEPPQPLDLIFSNACLHWVRDHSRLLPRLIGFLEPQGVLAVQMPDMKFSPSHQILRDMAQEDPWKEWLSEIPSDSNVQGIESYIALLGGLTVEIWETTYHHLLTGTDPVFEWMKGSAMRPMLVRLPPAVQMEFVEEYRKRVAQAYPETAGVVRLSFRRIFFVATG